VRLPAIVRHAQPRSLGARLALVAAAVLLAFFGLAGVALDRAYRASVEEAVRERLEVQIYLLLAAAEVDAAGVLIMPEAFTEPRYDSPASGLLAVVRDDAGESLWRSASSAGHQLAIPVPGRVGAFAHGLVADQGGAPYQALAYTVSWELADGGEQRLVFGVAEASEDADAQVAAFRRTLWLWLAGVGLALVFAQALVLRWSLAPLRRVAREVGAIERGERERLGAEYPHELRRLTESLNALISSSGARLTRYRNTLDDLAHSLKTPLAVLRGGSGGVDSRTVHEQVERMDQAIAYHVQRAATAGRAVLSGSIEPVPVIERLAAALDKVFADRGVVFELVADPAARFTGDPGDLTELLGNLLDNAYKWCAGRVRVTLSSEEAGGSRRLVIQVEDDGPGIPDPVRRSVLERGFRADELTPGQGIGLAVVREMVEEGYAGTLELATSEMGGASVRAVL